MQIFSHQQEIVLDRMIKYYTLNNDEITELIFKGVYEVFTNEYLAEIAATIRKTDKLPIKFALLDGNQSTYPFVFAFAVKFETK